MNTKYEIDQGVWVMYNNKPLKVYIDLITIIRSDRIEYRFKDYSGSSIKDVILKERLLFTSRQSLIQSL